MRTSNIYRILIGTGLILLIPLVAMVFTDDVDWNIFDFVVIGSLLVGAGILYEFATSRLSPKYRGAVMLLVTAAVVLVWMELAVGLFGSPIAGS